MTLQNAAPQDGPQSGSGADSASQEFENFIYLVSHDVRNSVRALLELPQWIEEDLVASGHPIVASITDNIELMNTHTRRLDRMLIDLLIYSRIGRMQNGRDIDWHSAIDTVLDQTQVPPGFRVVRDIRAPIIHIGETDVLTLISALVSNSFKHHDRKTGTVTISTCDVQGEIVLTVRDDGPGIPERYREKVFEVMSTLKPRDEVEGSGMGLANVRKIAAHYGARIEWADTGKPRGFGLSIHFPRQPSKVH